MPHAIRLNSAWEVRPLSETPASATDVVEIVRSTKGAGRINLPCNNLAAEITLADESHAGWLLTRRFNRPSNLAVDQPVTLVIAGVPEETTLYLNDALLSGDGSQFPIRDLLRDNNRLDVVLGASISLAAADFRLEIEESATS